MTICDEVCQDKKHQTYKRQEETGTVVDVSIMHICKDLITKVGTDTLTYASKHVLMPYRNFNMSHE